KFTVLLTEHLLNCDTENTPVETDWYIYTTGRFKHVFLAHAKEMWYYAKELDRELFSTSTIDPRILEIFNQFRALKRAGS
uniref:Uncharacterized protein n=1 Tax=Acrobeloides nanus TaxID=290746 RepID=A0A914DAF4_9BILA